MIFIQWQVEQNREHCQNMYMVIVYCLLFIVYWLLVIGYWLLVIGCCLLVIGDWFQQELLLIQSFFFGSFDKEFVNGTQ
jgi:hypothetical protein